MIIDRTTRDMSSDFYENDNGANETFSFQILVRPRFVKKYWVEEQIE